MGVKTPLIFDQRSALETIDDLVGRTSESSLSDKPHILLLVPDFITANQLKDYLTVNGKSLQLNSLYIVTIEDLAEKVVGESPLILDQELLKLILVSTISQLDDPIAAKIRQSFEKLDNPEDSTLVEVLLKELDEYSTLASPRHRNQDEIKQDMNKIIQNLPPLLQGQAEEALSFYSLLIQEAEKALSKLAFEERIYLTRAHLVSEACKELENTSLESHIDTEKITEICIFGIPIFDDTVLDFLSLLFQNRSQITINVSKEIARRLEKRLASKLGKKIKVQNIVPPQNPDQRITAFQIPDKRREVELAALTCLNLISDGVAPSNILITSRLASDYEHYFNSVFREYGLPTFMQTRISLLFTPPYRLLESLLQLLVRFEKGLPLSAAEIATPLRLGYPITYKWQGNVPRGKSRITDRRFLGIETELERLQKYHGKRNLKEWLTYLRERKANVSKRMGYYIYEPAIQVLDWIRKIGSEKPTFRPLIGLLNSFITIYGVQQEFPTMGMLPTARFDLAKEHITSEATRILQNLYGLIGRQKQFSQARSILEEKEKEQVTWSDVKKAYFSNIGNKTYGRTNRDSDAIRFVDAGLSHLIDAKHRIILGITSGQFPREMPIPFLIFPELRRAVNHPDHRHFLVSSETQYEVEKFLYSTAKGRAASLTLSMNYLDERGHSQHPSVFFPSLKFRRVAPHELKVELSEAFNKNTTHNLSSLLFHHVNHSQIKNTQDIDSQITSLFSVHNSKGEMRNEIMSINTSLRALLERVIHREFNPQLEIGPQQLMKEIFRQGRIPNSWEIDLVTYCPAMYYFYVFYYLLPNKNWIEEKRFSPFYGYIPSWKNDFRTGRLPIPVWRTRFSTVGSDWIEEKLDGETTLHRKDIASLEEEIDELKISRAEKTSLKYLLSYLSDLDNFTFKPRQESVSQCVVRPISIFFDQKHCVLYKLAPWEPYIYTHLLEDNFRHAISPLAPNRKYRAFGKCTLTQAKKLVTSGKAFSKYIKKEDLEVSHLPADMKLCSGCVYRTLCGEWGF